jgi:TRAP-type mannitol/chloroaromatic compound transport system permease small subunit
MNLLFKYVRLSDRISEGLGWLSMMAVLATVLVGVYNVAARYIGRLIGIQLSSNLYIELQWYLYAITFLLGFAYVLKNEINVRVDFLYAKWSAKRKAVINFFGHLFLLVPFCALAIWVAINPIMTSWGRFPNGSWCFESQGTPAILYFIDIFNILGNYCGEISPDPRGLNRAPIKTMLLVGFSFLLMQAIAELIKLFAVLTDRTNLISPQEVIVERDEPIRME